MFKKSLLTMIVALLVVSSAYAAPVDFQDRLLVGVTVPSRTIDNMYLRWDRAYGPENDSLDPGNPDVALVQIAHTWCSLTYAADAGMEWINFDITMVGNTGTDYGVFDAQGAPITFTIAKTEAGYWDWYLISADDLSAYDTSSITFKAYNGNVGCTGFGTVVMQQDVPEPATMVLLGVGSLAAVVRRRKNAV